ncbi:hypothetical protein C8R44DRAFT_745796 [Mycena epipterygia]|nr:hypothetical protein C8R44DRAFT_745796 [Mycena epipterygia]
MSETAALQYFHVTGEVIPRDRRLYAHRHCPDSGPADIECNIEHEIQNIIFDINWPEMKADNPQPANSIPSILIDQPYQITYGPLPRGMVCGGVAAEPYIKDDLERDAVPPGHYHWWANITFRSDIFYLDFWKQETQGSVGPAETPGERYQGRGRFRVELLNLDNTAHSQMATPVRRRAMLRVLVFRLLVILNITIGSGGFVELFTALFTLAHHTSM